MHIAASGWTADQVQQPRQQLGIAFFFHAAVHLSQHSSRLHTGWRGQQFQSGIVRALPASPAAWQRRPALLCHPHRSARLLG
jgi:hypothetical protein